MLHETMGRRKLNEQKDCKEHGRGDYVGEVCFILFCLMMGFFGWSAITKKELTGMYCNGKKWYGIFFGGCYLCLRWLRKKSRWKLKGERLEQLKKVYVGKKEEDIFYAYYGKTGCVISVVAAGCLFFGAVEGLMPKEEKLIKGYFLEREGVLGEDIEISLSGGRKGEKKEITVPVLKQKYTKKQCRKKIQKAKEYVNHNYLGENASEEEIEKPLKLIAVIPDSAIEVEWKLGNDGLIQEDGSIVNDDLEMPVQTEITVVFRYEEIEESLTKQLTVLPKQQTQAELFWKEWQKELEKKQLESQTEKYLELPSVVEGEKVEYQEKHISKMSLLFAGIFILPVLLILMEEEKLRKEILYREKELQMDYPEFVEQFVLLIGAGLTVKETWKRIALDYEERGNERHYVYEEMLVSIKEMENGFAEARAYELFGKRTGLMQYMKFCTLLVQNLRKGSSDLLKLLDYEVADAFRERKENAKTLGEEAGTKLLMPMMLMLIVVFAIILYAAFYNM